MCTLFVRKQIAKYWKEKTISIPLLIFKYVRRKEDITNLHTHTNTLCQDVEEKYTSIKK